MNGMKHGIWVLWVGCIVAILFGQGAVASWGAWILGLSFAVHIVEFFVNLPLFRRAGGSLANHFFQTLIYGLFHWTPIKQRLDSESAR